MACKFEVISTSGLRAPARFVSQARQLLRRTAACSAVAFERVTVVLVSPQVIRQLNRTYRNHDSTTDVLSFVYQAKPVVGEVVLCLERARQQAKELSTSLLFELERLVVHGYAHLAGYDHLKLKDRRAMQRIEQCALKRPVDYV